MKSDVRGYIHMTLPPLYADVRIRMTVPHLSTSYVRT